MAKQKIVLTNNNSVSLQKLTEFLNVAGLKAAQESQCQQKTVSESPPDIIAMEFDNKTGTSLFRYSNGSNLEPMAAPTILSAITRIFILVGIPANMKGYAFLREAVKQSVHNPAMVHNISRLLYPAVAKEFKTSGSVVEASIRHAIKAAWDRGASSRMNALFGATVFKKHERPTNSEFIALIADKLIIEHAAYMVTL